MEMSPEVNSLFKVITAEFSKFGKFDIEEKKTSFDITHKGTFVGIYPHKNGLILNIVSSSPIENPRITRYEQVSTSRFHNEVRIRKISDIDEEVISWLHRAYELMS